MKHGTARRFLQTATLLLMLSQPRMTSAQETLSWAEFQRLEPAEPGMRLSYGDLPQQFGELSLPPGAGPHPVAVVVHGGCWLSIADLTYMRHLSAALVAEGWAAWNLEFRRSDDSGGGWPGTFQDVGAGTDHLRELASRFPLDLGRVITVGHSSGGQLALWLAARPGLDSRDSVQTEVRGSAPLTVQGVIGLAAIADLEDFDQRTDRSCPRTAVPDLLGGVRAERPGRWAAVDPGGRLPLGVAQLLVTGELDGIVPLAHDREFGDRATAAGDTVRVLGIPGAGHFEVVAPWTSAWETLRPSIVDFLRAIEGPRRPDPETRGAG